MVEKPCAILKTTIRCAQFQNSSNVHNPSFRSLSSYCNGQRPDAIVVNLCCTFLISFFYLFGSVETRLICNTPNVDAPRFYTGLTKLQVTL